MPFCSTSSCLVAHWAQWLNQRVGPARFTASYRRRKYLCSSVSWLLEIAILSLVVHSLSYRSSSVSGLKPAASLRASSDENRLFLAFRLGIRILNLLNRYPETTTSVTTECKMWISQVSNCNHRLSRLLLDYRHWQQHREARLPSWTINRNQSFRHQREYCAILAYLPSMKHTSIKMNFQI